MQHTTLPATDNPRVTAPHRKDLERRETRGDARFLTFSTAGRLPLFRSDEVKEVFVDRLAAVRAERSFELFAWVVMPEHVHLLLRTPIPELTVPKLLRALKRPVSARILRRWREIDAPILRRIGSPSGAIRFWQPGGGYDRNINSTGEFLEKLRYIHRNPVTRELAETPADWPWSSARWYAGDHSHPVTIDPTPRLRPKTY